MGYFSSFTFKNHNILIQPRQTPTNFKLEILQGITKTKYKKHINDQY